MKLLTKKIIDALPLLKDLDQNTTGETKVPLKLFSPIGQAVWFIMAIDGDTKDINENTILYGVCHVFTPEFGSVSLQELKEMTLPMGFKIERDISWDVDMTLADANHYLKQNGYGNIDFAVREAG